MRWSRCSVCPRGRPRHWRHARARSRALRVLVAEDNLVNRKLVTRLLQKRGHRVTAVENGRAAVAALAHRRQNAFDVVLMDVQMPEMNGLEATAAIRQHEAAGGGHVPIVALTAHAMQGDRERCLAAGMDAYLAKPIDVEEMIATVEACAERGSCRCRKPPPPSRPGSGRSSIRTPRWALRRRSTTADGGCRVLSSRLSQRPATDRIGDQNEGCGTIAPECPRVERRAGHGRIPGGTRGRIQARTNRSRRRNSTAPQKP